MLQHFGSSRTRLCHLRDGTRGCDDLGPEPIRQRLSIGDGRVLLTTATHYKRKVAELRAALPGLKHLLLIGTPEEVGAIPA